MERVQGIGGVFFKAKDPGALATWYAQHLGVPVESWGGAVFDWRKLDPEGKAYTIWNAFDADSGYFKDSRAPFMLNFRVRDLDAMLAQLRAAGVAVDDHVEDGEFGRFGWCTDPDGNRVELWQPCT